MQVHWLKSLGSMSQQWSLHGHVTACLFHAQIMQLRTSRLPHEKCFSSESQSGSARLQTLFDFSKCGLYVSSQLWLKFCDMDYALSRNNRQLWLLVGFIWEILSPPSLVGYGEGSGKGWWGTGEESAGSSGTVGGSSGTTQRETERQLHGTEQCCHIQTSSCRG